MKVPNVGDTIYVAGRAYMGHGRDDYNGGRAVVVAVKQEFCGTMVSVDIGHSRVSMNWGYLGPQQERLRQMFGDAGAHPDPDMRPEYNDW